MQKTLMSKKLLALLLIVTLLPASLAFAKEDEKAENEVLKLSLEDAIKLAEENNQQVKLSELALEKAKLGRQQYRYQDKKNRGFLIKKKKKKKGGNSFVYKKKKQRKKRGAPRGRRDDTKFL